MVLAAMGIPNMDKGVTLTQSIGRLRNDDRTGGWLDIGRYDGQLLLCFSSPVRPYRKYIPASFFSFLSFPPLPSPFLPSS